MSEPTFPRTFVAQRDEDVSGISGEGVVAEGVQFSDGWAVTHWLDQPPMNEPKTDVWHNKGSAPFERVHGHGGSTRILWADEVAALRSQFVAEILEAYDVPPAILGADTEREHTAERIRRALLDATNEATQQWNGEYTVTGLLSEFANAVTPIVFTLMEQRDQVLTANGRAYGLARTWRRAHGSSNCLVRAAAVELHDVLSGVTEPDSDAAYVDGETTAPDRCPLCPIAVPLSNPEQATAHFRAQHPQQRLVGPGPWPQLATDDAPSTPSATCTALYTGPNFPQGECIRAAGHAPVTDHTDDLGNSWPDASAVYPVFAIPADADPGCRHRGPHPGFTCPEVDASQPYFRVRWGHDRQIPPATTCSARYTGVLDVGECIRAGGHIAVTDHTDDRGRNFGDSSAEYPAFDGPVRVGPARDVMGHGRAYASSCSNPDHACPTCGDCIHQHPAEGGCFKTNQLPPNQGPLTGVEVRDPCPHCEDCRLIPRTLMAGHIRDIHPDVTLVTHANADGAADPGRASDLSEIERLRAEIAQLHEGEDQYTDERVVPTPAQWIWRWNRATPARRLKVAAHVMEAWDRSFACVLEDHRGEIEELRTGSAATVSQACPYCSGAPMFPRHELGAHIQQQHARIVNLLASGASLDEQLADPETRCRLPHEMEA